jgi:potassium/chloride transporter 4/5/6
MINLISQLMKRGKGISFVAGAIPGKFNTDNHHKASEAKKRMVNLLRDRHVSGFPEVIVSNTIAEGHVFLIQGKGFGVLRPNTVMMGFPSPEKLASMSQTSKDDLVRTWKAAQVGEKTLMLCKGSRDFPNNSERLSGYLDVWWVFDILPARGMLLIIPYLLQQSKVWRGTTLRLFVVTGYGEDVPVLTKTLQDMLAAAGLAATVHVIQMDAKDAPRYTHAQTGKDISSLSTLVSQNTSIQGLTQYLAEVSLNIQTEQQSQSPHSVGEVTMNPTFEAVADETVQASAASTASLHGETDASGRGISHHSENGAKAHRKKGQTLDKKNSLNFLASDKFGSRLTEAFFKWSGNSALTVIASPRQHSTQSSVKYLDSLSTLIQDLPLVIMIQESGNEKVQLYA